MSDMQINAILQQIRQINLASQGNAGIEKTGKADGADFGSLLKNAVSAVNETQMKAGEMSRAFELGDESVDLPQLMVTMEKASISFEAMKQVRNKMVEAYKEIMSMTV